MSGHEGVMDRERMLHILRNPYGYAEEVVRTVRLQAADALDSEPAAFLFTVRRNGRTEQFAALDYRPDPEEIVVARVPLYR